MTTPLSSVDRVPGPVSRYGVFTNETVVRPVPYDGSWITHFIGMHGGDPTKHREILRANRIGAVIVRGGEGDLYRGRSLLIPQKPPTVARHREYFET